MTFSRCMLFVGIACIAALTACSEKTVQKPKNIIYMIGDGMSMAHLTAYRHFSNSNANHIGLGDQKIPTTLFDQYLVGVASTHPEDDTLVTDSAASATALSSAEKTYNGAIALDNDKSELLTVIQRAKQLGKLTGTISTSQITHATPASFWAHNESRANQNAIADDAFDRKIEGKFTTDLLLGGGTKYLIREDRNIVQEFQNNGWQYQANLADLDQFTELPALGLFAEKGLPYAIDNTELPNRLEAMTKKGLQLLNQNNPNGFFVMIEGSQIDWCSHGNDIACAMHEMRDFELAFKAALDFAEKDGNTLIVLTADHGTGGLSVGANKKYLWLPDVVHKVGISAEEFTKRVASGEDIEALWQQYNNFDLTAEQLTSLKELQISKDLDNLFKYMVKIVNEKSYTGWTTTGHVGGDVAVISFGPHSEIFAGYQDNTDLSSKLFQLIEK
ncbi:MAG: alkaline phosphatase [Gammaproteobacteria bacterium]|nr:alkaline phosphatase [Gammaproteobacteria bacterium]